jgi:uncharacterized protein (TIGR00269 family)
MNASEYFKPFSEEKKCSLCDKKAFVYKRIHSGQYLCQKCFIESIEKIIYKTISKFNMLKPEDNIIVGLSGGKDSVVLLYNLKKIQNKTYNSKPLIALSIDEGINKYSQLRIQKAINLCKKFEISHKIISFKEYIGKSLDDIVMLKKDKGDFRYPCNYCATIKRRLLNDIAKELNGTVLALGHNLTDISESYIMNILYNRLPLIARTSLSRKNSKLNEAYLDRIFPLMRIPENEVELYAKLKQFDYYKPVCPNRKDFPILRRKVLEFLLNIKQQSPEIEFNLFNGYLKLISILNEEFRLKNNNFCIECGYPTSNPLKCTYCKLLEEIK